MFKIIGKPARGKTCDAINGITEEGAEIMKDFKGAPALDAGLAAAAQSVEHYEISRYGTLATWAAELGFEDAAWLIACAGSVARAYASSGKIKGLKTKPDQRLADRYSTPILTLHGLRST